MQKNSLVIFKNKPAKVINFSDKKVEIEILNGKKINLPARIVQLLIESEKNFQLNQLKQLDIFDLETTWNFLQDQPQISITNLCQLLFQSYEVNQAYTIWLLVLEGEYFSFNNDFSIKIHTPEQKEQIILEKFEKQKNEQELKNFIHRLQNNIFLPKDKKFLKKIEDLAILKTSNCIFLKYLNIAESENNAHKILLNLGYWDKYQNPYLYRHKAELENNPAEFKYNLNSDINRIDLTHLNAYAIDDEDTNDPDDAISWDLKNKKIWVHIADPSSSISFGDQIDLEARTRSSNLYVPEKTILMLPPEATQILGLGLKEISPALSIGFRLTDNDDVDDIKICFSKIKVTRLSYSFVEKNINKLDIANITKFTTRFTKKRLKSGGVELDLPAVKIKLKSDKKVSISCLPKLESCALVKSTMLMAGVAVGKFCIKNNIEVPFYTQLQHDLTQLKLENISTPADMFAARKKLQKSLYTTQSNKHAGMGLENYVQVTSPLRRYLDLIIHYQLRNFLTNQKLLDAATINKIIIQTDTQIKINKQTERYSNLHWKLVYLLQNPNAKFNATVIKHLAKNKTLVTIDKLAMTKKIFINHKLDLNNNLVLENISVNLATQENDFKVIK